MKCIVNYLLALIAVLWGRYAYGEFDTSPFCIWFTKCWEYKEREGEIGWNAFLAIMKFFTLYKIGMHDRAESPTTYAKLVDMSPFIYGIPEEEWDNLAYHIYIGDNNAQTPSKPKQNRKKKTTKKKKKNETII